MTHKTVYFLGAGASAADDLPLTNELNLAIAAYLLERDLKQSALATYYRRMYGITARELKKAARAWEDFLETRKRQKDASSLLPNVVETLSLIDLAILENTNFGSISDRHRFKGPAIEGSMLLDVRTEMTQAIAHGVKRAGLRRPAPNAKRLAARLKSHDVVITTNWDVLIDRGVITRVRVPKQKLAKNNIDYGAVDERAVNWQAEDLPAANTLFKILKLHGSLNWFYCGRCSDLYANVELPWVIDTKRPRQDYDFCHCGVPLRNIMIAPSYLKDYGNAHLASVWRHATTQLLNADRWVFIGYSLPADDYHIRGMLLRALRANIERSGEPPTIHVAYYGPDDLLVARYRDLLRLADPQPYDKGMKEYLDRPESRISR